MLREGRCALAHNPFELLTVDGDLDNPQQVAALGLVLVLLVNPKNVAKVRDKLTLQSRMGFV